MFTRFSHRAASRPAADRERLRPSRLGFELLEDRSLPSNVILHWNEILLQSLATPTAPVPLSRNMALVSAAMFDAVNAITGSYEPYAAHVNAAPGASPKAAAAQAAHDTLVALYPSRQATFDAALAEDLAGIPAAPARQGMAVGQKVARQILALRADDGSGTAMTWTPPNNDPGTYQLTPPNNADATNFHFQFITPFATTSSSQFRPGPYPALDSPEYAADFNEVKVIGASDADEAGVDRDGNGMPDRTADQTLVAELWRVPLGNHTVWNRIAQDQAETNDLSLTETARLFALLNMALNDGLQTSFASKYHYELWRPITAIRRAAEDGNDATVAETGWMTEHPSTPPYPAYASNASAIGAACATVLTEVFGPDVSIQVNWSQGARSYDNFWAAADEMADSRIYGGIHFRFDCVAGQEIGADVADYVIDHFLVPVEGNAGPLRSAHPGGAGMPGEGGPLGEVGATGLFLGPDAAPAPGGKLTVVDAGRPEAATPANEDLSLLTSHSAGAEVSDSGDEFVPLAGDTAWCDPFTDERSAGPWAGV